MVWSTAIAGSGASLSVTVMTEGATEALLESTLIDEPVESTTIEELESTVRTEAAGVVAEDVAEEIVLESMMME
jgi:hypothetical protein